MKSSNPEIIHHPTVYYPTPLIDFIHFITQHSPAGAILVICTTRQSFLSQLQESILNSCHEPEQNEFPTSGENALNATSTSLDPIDHPLFARTLRLLAISRKIKLLFCPTVAVFHAQIATLSLKESVSATGDDSPPMLAILNLIRMHRPTASYSAQGLGKAMAAAVEAAWQIKHRLILFEYLESIEAVHTSTIPHGDHSDPLNEPIEPEDEEADRSPSRGVAMSVPENPWLEQVQILNATTKTFGNVGNRGWMGKTVEIADIAARWCAFATLPGSAL